MLPFKLAILLLAPSILAAQEERGRLRTPEPAADEQPDTLTVVLAQGIKARAIGPALMGGRIADIALDPTNSSTFYLALGTAGVMKTTDNGGTFQGIFEKESVAAVGAVAVAPSDSSVVWVGTGEANDRNSSSWGNGVYRSTDGGATWTHAGLRNSKTIARIVVHPSDPKTAYIAAMGDLWGSSAERGCYKTTDAGTTWKAVLTAPAPHANKTGCGDVALDPTDPNTVYATLYARYRQPWAFSYGVAVTGGKDVGGIFKSSDAGATWKKLSNGLPSLTGRIGLDIYRKDPKIVYAIVQSDEGGTSNIDQVKSKRGGVFRSDDKGESWTRMNALNPRAFYFSQIRVDPADDKKISVLGYALHVSEDGGRSFREDRFKNIHPDNHALVIDPKSPNRLLLGTDGGLYQSYNSGEGWEFINRFAGGQFYRINADMSTPYRVCGGLQDNLNWVGPSQTNSKEGILNSDWINIAGGDGFYCVFDPDSSDIVFAESQQGYVHRMHLKTGELKQLRPEPTEGQTAYRFHWNSPLIPSKHTRGAMYLAGNRVFKLTDRGESWRPISPDLSTQNVQRILATGSGAENYGVVYALAESPVKAGLIWAGTDDGKLWITENDGESWTDLTSSLPAAVKGEWISRIEASPHDARVAYLAVDAHRSQKYQPLAYRTADAGKTWQSIAGNLPGDGPVKVVREDLKNPNLLFAGTEFGLFASFDRGRRWGKFGKLPTVAVDDIMIHPRDNDLIVATHGRSLYIVDDISALQGFTAEVRQKEIHLFEPRPARGAYLLPGWADWSGSAVYRGANPQPGATLTYYVKRFSGEPVNIAITTPSGTPVANLTAAGAPGLNRVTWDLVPTKDLLTEYGGEGQKFVPSGEYTVTLTYGREKATQKLKVEIATGVETR
ncbi:MAG: WD40/YVTN/BNR-like repeat-containing protein [Gemmatimonadaceae bacterium]